jgi:branched-chain amino acid transport system permease protein
MGSIYILMVLGLQVIIRTTGIVNFAHGQFYVIGAYAFWFLYVLIGLNIGLAIALTLVVMMILGGLSYRGIFEFIRRRFRPDTPLSQKFLMSAMASVGLMMILARIIILIFGSETRGIPSMFPAILTIGDVRLPAERLAVVLISTSIVALLFLFFAKTRLGKAMRAVMSDADAGSLMGINAGRIYLVSFAFGCSLAGIAGVLIGSVFSLSPDMAGDIMSMSFLVMVLGGVRSYTGAIMGGVVVGLALSVGYQFLGGAISYVVVFAGTMLFLAARPGGILHELTER